MFCCSSADVLFEDGDDGARRSVIRAPLSARLRVDLSAHQPSLIPTQLMSAGSYECMAPIERLMMEAPWTLTPTRMIVLVDEERKNKRLTLLSL
jgi:hypothetical protein